MKYFLMFVAILVCKVSFATTWDEPWHEEILKTSESFVLVKIDSINAEKGVWATLIKNLAGKEVKHKIYIDDFFALRFTSYSHPAEFRLPPMDTAYFFLVEGEKGNYQMPTPTSGFAWKKGNGVSATYRISMHKTKADVDMYEKTTIELFNYLRTGKYDNAYFSQLFDKYLKQEAGKVDGTESERELFFKQHIALESFYYVGSDKYYPDILKFLESDQFHNQISGVRALSKIKTTISETELMKFIENETRNMFAKVCAVGAIRRLDAKELKNELEKFLPKASEDFVSFGLDIMDVRIGTKLPDNLKAAIEELLTEWEK